jgi:hypothetical protein
MALVQTAIFTASPDGVRSVFEQSGRANCQAERATRLQPTPSIAGKSASILRKICKQMLTRRTSDPA